MIRPVLSAGLAATLLAALLAACAGQGPGGGGQAGAVIPCGSDAASGPPPPGCGLVCRAELPVRMQNGEPIVTVWLDDQPANLLFDTGASLSSLTTEAAKRLGFTHVMPAHGRVWGIGGGQARALVRVRRLAFGHVSVQNADLAVLVTGRALAGEVPDGGLGDDVLRNYEVDLDLPHDAVRLYQGRPCDGQLPGWTTQDATLPWTRAFPVGWQVSVPVILDGYPTQALIDSGAQTTVVGVPAALAAGVPQAELTSDLEAKMFGIGPGQVPGKLHRFASLVVGGQTIPDVEAAVIAVPFRSPGMVLGADYLQNHKVWISYATGQVHVAHTW